ncbi:hypothetical protein HPGCJGGD_2567 [Methylobacterium haplocladii]|nr:hypothetical protein HPGCJGGD_2567 [Methylobacterium haplocladii]
MMFDWIVADWTSFGFVEKSDGRYLLSLDWLVTAPPSVFTTVELVTIWTFEVMPAASFAVTASAPPAVMSLVTPVLSIRAVALPLTLFEDSTTPKPEPPEPFIESVDDIAALLIVALILAAEVAETVRSPPAFAEDLTIVALAPEPTSPPKAPEMADWPIRVSTALNSRF